MRAILIAILLIAVSAGPLYAQSDGRGKREHPDRRGQLEKLNLTTEQKGAMRDIRIATKKQMIDVRADLQKKRLAMQEILAEEVPDRTAFESISREISDLQLRQKMLLFDSRQEVMQLLDAEQKELFREMQHHRMMMREERRNGRRPAP